MVNWFTRRGSNPSVVPLYQGLVAQARDPGFYSICHVPDTLDGRFELLIMHVALILRRLRGESSEISQFGQRLFDRLFVDMDNTLRELGVGDLSVSKHVRRMGEGFYGRADAYTTSLDAGDDAALRDAIDRNIFGTLTEAPSEASVATIARYMAATAAALADTSTADVMALRIDFPAVALVSSSDVDTQRDAKGLA